MMVARVFTEEGLCWLCGRWVDHTLPGNHPLGHTVDHLVQLDHDGPELARDNLRLAHRSCNTARSNRLRRILFEDCACRHGFACGPLVASGPPRSVFLSVDLKDI
jgi:hypothetical protein